MNNISRSTDSSCLKVLELFISPRNIMHLYSRSLTVY